MINFSWFSALFSLFFSAFYSTIYCHCTHGASSTIFRMKLIEILFWSIDRSMVNQNNWIGYSLTRWNWNRMRLELNIEFPVLTWPQHDVTNTHIHTFLFCDRFLVFSSTTSSSSSSWCTVDLCGTQRTIIFPFCCCMQLIHVINRIDGYMTVILNRLDFLFSFLKEFNILLAVFLFVFNGHNVSNVSVMVQWTMWKDRKKEKKEQD